MHTDSVGFLIGPGKVALTGIPLGKLVSKGPVGAVGTVSISRDTHLENNNDFRKSVSMGQPLRILRLTFNPVGDE